MMGSARTPMPPLAHSGGHWLVHPLLFFLPALIIGKWPASNARLKDFR